MGTSRRLLSIDFLRGVAALAVVFHHAFSYEAADQFTQPWFRALHRPLSFGYLGVRCSSSSPAFAFISAMRAIKSQGELSYQFVPF